MDPASIVALLEGSVSLALQCGSATKSLSNIAERYRSSKMEIMSIIQYLDTMQLAWSRIKDWSQAQRYSLDMRLEHDCFVQRLNRSLEVGKLVMDVLQEDLRFFQPEADTLTFKQRSKAVWNQDTLRNHQDRIRDQAASMTLLLQAVQLKVPEARQSLLYEAEPILRKSDESVTTIVPSEPSYFSISTHSTHSSRNSKSKSLAYHPLSFEDDLFTARVYKRNYRHSLLLKAFRSKGARPSFFGQENQSVASSDPIDRPSYETGLPIKRKAKARGLSPGSRHLSHTPRRSTSLLSRSISSGCNGCSHCGEPEDPLLLTQWVDPPSALFEICKGSSGLSVEAALSTGCSLCGTLKSSVALKPIHVAAIHGQSEVVRALLKYGASVEEQAELARDHCIYAGWRPLHFAIRRGHASLTAILLEQGADVSARTTSGDDPIHIWAANCDRIDILRILLDNSADINSMDANDETPLQLARAYGKKLVNRDFSNWVWGAELDLGSLLKSVLTAVICCHDSRVLPELLVQSAASTRANGLNAIRLFTVTAEHGDSSLLSSLDIEFFRLFLTFNAYEDARHHVCYNVTSRWSIPNIEALAHAPEKLCLRELIATFDGTAQVRREYQTTAHTKGTREVDEAVDIVCFTIMREGHRMRLEAVLGDRSLQGNEANSNMPSWSLGRQLAETML